jgi:hypothetical protein
MTLLKLKPLDDQNSSKTLRRAYDSFDMALKALNDRSLSDAVIVEINDFVSQINAENDPKKLKTLLQKKRYSLVQLLEKKENLVPKNRYRNLWMVLGMTTFGVPFGLIFAAALDSMAFFAIGLPLGMPIGMALGAQKDKKAKEEGRQLDFEA